MSNPLEEFTRTRIEGVIPFFSKQGLLCPQAIIDALAQMHVRKKVSLDQIVHPAWFGQEYAESIAQTVVAAEKSDLLQTPTS